MQAQVTQHAQKRIRKRIHINKKSSERQCKLALERGYDENTITGRLKDYIYTLSLRSNTNLIKIYNNQIFIFKNEKLITVWNIPNKLNKKQYFLNIF